LFHLFPLIALFSIPPSSFSSFEAFLSHLSSRFFMASIKDLLNPSPDSLPEPHRALFRELPRVHELPELPKGHYGLFARVNTAPPATTPRVHEKKPKMPKDSPVFRPGKTQGEVRYPPCEERDEELTRTHKAYALHPMGEIALYPRHIPYQSDKKSFQEKTGRDSFHGMSLVPTLPPHPPEY